MGFKIKCLNSVRELMADAAVVFVSHSMQFVSQFCNRIAVMEKGLLKCDTLSISEGIDGYLSQFPTETAVAGTGGAVIENIQLHTKNKSWDSEDEAIVHQGEELNVTCDIKILDLECKNTRFFIHIMDQGFEPIIAFETSKSSTLSFAISTDLYRAKIELGKIDLNAGKYSLVISVENADSRIKIARIQGCGKFRVLSELMHWGSVVRQAEISFEQA